jgi:hypothetical protein
MTRRFPTWWWMIPVIGLAGWLGLRGLSEGMLWYDEWWSYFSAGGTPYGPISFGEVIDRALGEPSQPPAYYLLLSAWGSVAGWTPFAVRFISFVFGILTLAWTYRLATDISGRRRTGILAALLLAGSALFVDYLHELRLYSMMTLFSVMTISVYWRMRRGGGRGAAVLLVLAVAGAVYSHLLTLLTLSAIGLVHLANIRPALARDRHWWQITGLMVLGGLAYLPWLGITLGAVSTFTESGGRTDTRMTLDVMLVHTVYAFSNGTFVLAAVALLAPPRRGAVGRNLLWGLVVLITAQAVVLHLIGGILTHARYLLSLWPLLVSLGAVGILSLRPRTLATGVTVLWLGFGVYNSLTPGFYATLFREAHDVFFRPTLPLDDFGAIVKAEAVPGDVALLHAPANGWAISGSYALAVHGSDARYSMVEDLPVPISEYLADAGRVWWAEETDAGVTEQYLMTQALLTYYVDCGPVFDHDRLTARLYARVDVLCQPGERAIAQFGADVFALGARLTAFDNQVEVITSWQTDDIPADTYSVGLYVFDAAGEFVAQGQDFALPLGVFGYSLSQINLDDLPPGSYTVTAAVYAWRTGERLPTGSPRQDAVIGTVTLR